MARILTIYAAQLAEGDVIVHDWNGRPGERDRVTGVQHYESVVCVFTTASREWRQHNYTDHFDIDCIMTFGCDRLT